MSSEWYTASAPGKFVVLGEHSVVYGKPAVVLATDRRITCSVRRSKKNSLNGEYLDLSKQPHFNYLTRNLNHCLDFLTANISEIDFAFAIPDIYRYSIFKSIFYR